MRASYCAILLLVSLWLPGYAVGEFVTIEDRSWIDESEFDDSNLHATRRHTIILHLEGRDDANVTGPGKQNRSVIRKNTFRFLVEKTRDFSFCIPADEPDVVRLKLKGPAANGKAGNRNLTVVRGGVCKPETLVPGSYTIEVDHDTRKIPVGGKLAFFHLPQKTKVLGDLAAGVTKPDFISFRAPNGYFVSAGNKIAKPDATIVSVNEVWELLDPTSTTDLTALSSDNITDTNLTTYALWPASETQAVMYVFWSRCGMGTTIYVTNAPAPCAFTPASFQFNDHGNGEFDLVDELPIGGVYASGTDHLYIDEDKKTTGATMTLEYKGFYCDPDSVGPNGCGVTTPTLAKGEVAFYSECNFKGPPIIFSRDIPDMSIYDQAAAAGVGIGNDMTMSLRVGPDTLVKLYADPNYGGEFATIGSDVPCLGVDQFSDVQDTVSSFKVSFADEYIVSTKGCQSCYLAGISGLEGEDFTEFDFSYTNFDGADLSNTIFKGAKLTVTQFSGATLTGTDFSDANLACTEFNGADLTSATFQDNTVIEDFSCYLNLTNSTLDYSYFPKEKWRYINLTNTNMLNVPAVLSSEDDPLDISGAILTSVQWLEGRQLDSVNMGCYSSQPESETACPDANGTKNCTNAAGVNLLNASLTQACMSSADMQGAILARSNLAGADMSGIKLLAATPNSNAGTLRGAFMRNVNLSKADITGVDLSNANFFSSSNASFAGTALANNISASGAKFSNAWLVGADFSGDSSNLQGTDWSGAVLVAAKFKQSNLSEDTNFRVSTSFVGAHMQGTDFSNQSITNLTSSDFTDSYWDLSNARTLNYRLPISNLEFRDYWNAGTCSDGSGTFCTASTDCTGTSSCNFVNQSGVCSQSWDTSSPVMCTNDADCGGDSCVAQPECVQATYSQPAVATPFTNSNNLCPDGAVGPCDGRWESPTTPITEATPPSAIDPAYPVEAGTALQCKSYDFDWAFPL